MQPYLNAAVLTLALAALGPGARPVEAVALHLDPAGVDALAGQVRARVLGSLERQLLVELFVAGEVACAAELSLAAPSPPPLRSGAAGCGCTGAGPGPYVCSTSVRFPGTPAAVSGCTPGCTNEAPEERLPTMPLPSRCRMAPFQRNRRSSRGATRSSGVRRGRREPEGHGGAQAHTTTTTRPLASRVAGIASLLFQSSSSSPSRAGQSSIAAPPRWSSAVRQLATSASTSSSV